MAVRDGRDRLDLLSRPHRASGRKGAAHHAASAAAGAPLVVVLHGARGTAADMRANLGWDALADREGFVVAYPDGLDRTPSTPSGSPTAR